MGILQEAKVVRRPSSVTKPKACISLKSAADTIFGEMKTMNEMREVIREETRKGQRGTIEMNGLVATYDSTGVLKLTRG